MTNFYRNMKTATFALALSVTATTFAQEGSLNIEVTDIASTNAHVTVTPSSDDIKYYANVLSKSAFEADGGIDKAIDNRIAIWERQAGYYDGETWQSYMYKYCLFTGEKAEYATEYTYDPLFPDTDYVVYAFGMNSDGTVSVPVTVKEFKTEAVPMSDNTFDLSVTEIKASYANRFNVKAKCVPSNDDTYVVRCILKSIVEKYDLTPGGDGEKNFIIDYMSLSDANPVSGTQEFTFNSLTADTNYYLVALGVNADKAANTSLTLLPFLCTDKPVETTESLTVNLTNISSTDATVTVTPSSDELKYYINVMTKLSFERDGGADKAIEKHISQWKASAEYYDDTTWQTMMSYSLVSGVTEEMASYWTVSNLVSDTQYVAYAFGMDADGNVAAPLVVKEFTTLTAEPSNNTFDISLVSIEPYIGERLTANIKCVPSNDTDKYYMWYYTKDILSKYGVGSNVENDKDFISTEMMYDIHNNSIVSGTQNVQYRSLIAGTEYGVVVVGVNDDLAINTPLTVFYFTAEENASPVTESIALNVTDITPMNAHITITPSNDEMLYYFDVTTPEIIEMHGGKENIPDGLIIDWWKWLADMYGGTYTWQDFMKMQTRTGAMDFMAADLTAEGDLSYIYWDQDWVLYAVGFNENGDVITPPATFDFTTPSPEKSNLDFQFDVVSIEDDADHSTDKSLFFNATILITPSVDQEEYLVNYCKTIILDQYDDQGEQGEKDFITDQFMQYAVKFDGIAQVTIPGLAATQYGGTVQEYYLIAMGWNEGPTTPIYKLEFDYDTPSGIKATAINDVMVMGGNGAIYVTGPCEGATVHSVSGQCMGALRTAGTVKVPAGIYVVSYTAEGKTKSAKVMVK